MLRLHRTAAFEFWYGVNDLKILLYEEEEEC